MRNERFNPYISSDNDNRAFAGQAHIDLALLFTTELLIGAVPFYKQKVRQSSLDIAYDIDGALHHRSYPHGLSWRTTLLHALTNSKAIKVHEIDRPGRYRRLFPITLLRRLKWYARPDMDFPPVARLYDPNGRTVMLLTRSRLDGHAVDALHNVSGGAPVFQPLWVSDIMALRPMLGIDLVHDETFATASPISAYIRAAARTGRIVDAHEVSELEAPDGVQWLPLPRPTTIMSSIFNQLCREFTPMETLRGRTIYNDYLFGYSSRKVR